MRLPASRKRRMNDNYPITKLISIFLIRLLARSAVVAVSFAVVIGDSGWRPPAAEPFVSMPCCRRSRRAPASPACPCTPCASGDSPGRLAKFQHFSYFDTSN